MKGTTLAGVWVLGIGAYLLMVYVMYALGADWRDQEARAVAASFWPLVLPVWAFIHHPAEASFIAGTAGLGLLTYSRVKESVITLTTGITTALARRKEQKTYAYAENLEDYTPTQLEKERQRLKDAEREVEQMLSKRN